MIGIFNLPDNAFLSSSLEINPGSCPCGPVAEPIDGIKGACI